MLLSPRLCVIQSQPLQIDIPADYLNRSRMIVRNLNHSFTRSSQVNFQLGPDVNYKINTSYKQDDSNCFLSFGFIE